MTLVGTGGGSSRLQLRRLPESTSITTGGGAINVTGRGGGDTTGYDNYGIYTYSTTLDTSGSGATGGIVALTGTGGNGMGSNVGVYLGNTTTTAGGDVTLTGFGGGVDGGEGNDGVVLDSSSIFSSGNVTALGYAGAGTYAYGINVSGSVVLRADKDGTGIGTVSFGDSDNVMISALQPCAISTTTRRVTPI